MKKHLPYVCIALFGLFVFSCSNKYYTANNFSEKTEDHKKVAILPAEIVFSGKQPKNMSPEAIAKAGTYIVTLQCEGESFPESHRAHLVVGFKA